MEVENTNWYLYMDDGMKALSKLSFDLLNRELKDPNSGANLPDYGFVVFPIAKAFEGFLKKLFFDLELINRQQYNGEHFRIGKALNPSLPIRYRHGWVYDKLVAYCNGDEIALALWDAWKSGRNRVFHFFPTNSDILPLSEAHDLVHMLASAMSRALAGCSPKV